MFSQIALINVLKEKILSNSITKVSIFYHAQTTNNSFFKMSEGSHILNDFQNVEVAKEKS